MVEYLFCFIFLLFGYISISKNKSTIGLKKGLWIVILLSVFALLLSKHSPDRESYKLIYKYGEDRIEPLFLFVRNFCQSLGCSFDAFLFVIAIISCSIKLLAITKLTDRPYVAILTWLSYLFVMQEMIALRIGIASGIILLAIYNKLKGNTKYMLLCVAVAVCFHYTAIICLPFLFCSLMKPHRFFYLSLILFSYIICIAGFNLFPYISNVNVAAITTLYEMYEAPVEANPFNLVQLARILLCFIFWWKVGDLRKVFPNILIFLKMYTVGCCMFPLFSEYVAVAIRLSDILFVSSIILYPMLAELGNKKYGKLMPVAVAMVLGFFTIKGWLFTF